jgi:hypothetical protein
MNKAVEILFVSETYDSLAEARAQEETKTQVKKKG